MVIKFGPAGIGTVKDIEETFKEYNKKGIRAAEIPFTYGVFIKKDEDIERVRKAAEKYDISLSIHAQYWVNLNSDDKTKKEMSKKRILSCCRVGEKLGAKTVVFHPGYYGKMSREETYENIKESVLDMMKEIKKNKWKIQIAAETMGKINVFGDVNEIKRLVKDTKCSFCLDFAHLYARSLGKMKYEEMVKEFKEFKEWHCHFSGIIFGDKGERKHQLTPDEELKKLLKALPKNKNITIINESPNPPGDSVKTIKFFKKI